MQLLTIGCATTFRQSTGAVTLLLASSSALIGGAATLSGVPGLAEILRVWQPGSWGPFVHGDVFLVCVAAVLPGTTPGVRHLAGCCSPFIQVVSGCLLALIAWLIGVTVCSGDHVAAQASPAFGVGIRLLISILVAAAIQFLVSPLAFGCKWRFNDSAGHSGHRHQALRWLVFSAALLLILPSSWIRARCEADLRLYREFL
ncbi:MAG: hypothetical protein ACKOEO_05010 [Planctomycetaceae bacterium]